MEQVPNPRYMVVAYLPASSRNFYLVGPVLVETRDYLHFYLAGTPLVLNAIGYHILREYPAGMTEEQALDFYYNSFIDLLRITMTVNTQIPRRAAAALELIESAVGRWPPD